MSGTDTQTWYLEEIPGGEGDEEVGTSSTSNEPSTPVHDGSPNANQTRGITEVDLTAADTAPFGAGGRSASCTGTREHHGESRFQTPYDSGASWASKSIAASSSTQTPCARGGCTWTKVGSKCVLFGGAEGIERHFADVHCFDTTTGKWEHKLTKGTPPSPRSGHTAVALGSSLIIYGGMNGQEGVTYDDLFELNTRSMEWIRLSCPGIPPRNSHAAVLYRDNMIIMGGASPEGQTDDVYVVDLSHRSSLSCRRVCCESGEGGESSKLSVGGGGLPVAMEMHSACLFDSELNETGATILIMGGRSSDGVLKQLLSLQIESWKWRVLKDAPVPRCAHSACFLGDTDTLAIHGGWDGGTTVSNDVHLYDTSAGRWTTTEISPRPPGRFAHCACAGPEKSLFIFGGVNPGEDLSDVVVLVAP